MKDMNLKSMNHSNLNINQSCDALLAKLNNDELNTHSNTKANFNLNNRHLNMSNFNVSNANIISAEKTSRCATSTRGYLKNDEFEYDLDSSSDIVDVESILPNEKDSLCGSGGGVGLRMKMMY